MTNELIKLNNLQKEIDGTKIVDINKLTVNEGEIYGFLGPNGAGKSTTMKLILGLMEPTQGEISLFGKKVKGNRNHELKQVGSLIEEPSYYANLTGYENLMVMQKLLRFPKKNIMEVLSIVGLVEAKDKLVKNYSLGMKQRLGIALAIVRFPKILILDEPTNGLDPAGIHEIRELIKSFPKKYGITVMISSHILSEIEQMATTVGILNHGKLLYEGYLRELEDGYSGNMLFRVNDQGRTVLLEQLTNFEITADFRQDGYIQTRILKDKDTANLIRSLSNQAVDIYEIKKEKDTLESIFLEMTMKEGV